MGRDWQVQHRPWQVVGSAVGIPAYGLALADALSGMAALGDDPWAHAACGQGVARFVSVGGCGKKAWYASFIMHAGEFSDQDFATALARSGARVLLIGRRALILLGAPVMTTDYDVWLHIDDVEKLNATFDDLDHVPNRTPEEARARGRYVIENGERIDVMVARAASTADGQSLAFDDAWSRRMSVEMAPGITIFVPSIADLIVTKRWGSRPKDIVDIQYLEALRQKGGAA